MLFFQLISFNVKEIGVLYRISIKMFNIGIKDKRRWFLLIKVNYPNH